MPEEYDLAAVYRWMFRSRLFEEAVAGLWNEGRISGEMHLGTGEEAVNAGVVLQLREGDAMALDHRGSSPLVLRGVAPAELLSEFLGREDGLCGGCGGHMHLFSREHITVSSGIVGASGPAAVGFALSGIRQRPGSIAVAFFGEGAINQGMMMESMNLASVWHLPVLFVCKDDGWSITESSERVTGASLVGRAYGLGLSTAEVDGLDVEAVWETAGGMIDRMRAEPEPAFLHARCVHLEGHFLGFQLMRAIKHPLGEMPQIAAPLTRALFRSGGESIRERRAGLRQVLGAIRATARDQRRDGTHDPVARTRDLVIARGRNGVETMEDEEVAEIDGLLARI